MRRILLVMDLLSRLLLYCIDIYDVRFVSCRGLKGRADKATFGNPISGWLHLQMRVTASLDART